MRHPRALAGTFAAVLSAVLLLGGAGPTFGAARTGGVSNGSAMSGSAATTTAATTTAATSAGPDGRLSVAVIVPVTVAASSPGLLTVDELTRLTASDGQLSEELDAVAGQQVALAIDPRIIASIRVLGDKAPTSALHWLSRLTSLGLETFPLLYADADPVLVGQAGGTVQTVPLSFDYAIDSSAFSSPTATATPSASASGSSGSGSTGTATGPSSAPSLPRSVSDVTGIGWTFSGLVWPAADTVVAADLPRLATAGYSTVLLGSDNASGDRGLVDLAGATGIRGLVLDDRLGTDASAVADAATGVAAATATPALDTALAAAATDALGATRVIALDRAPDSRSSLPILMNALAAAGVDTVPLASAVDGTAGTASVVDRPESNTRLAAITRVLGVIPAEQSFSSVASDPLAVTAPRRLDLLALLSTEWSSGSAWNGAVTRFLTDSVKLLDSVSIVASSPTTALGANTPLPVTVRNELSVPVTVYAIARPQRATLSIPAGKRRVEITVPADTTQTTRIPTQSVANGKVNVEVTLVSATGVQIGPTSAISVNVQAGWETVGTLVAVVLVLGVFGFGVTRNILRRRRARAEPAGAADSSG